MAPIGGGEDREQTHQRAEDKADEDSRAAAAALVAAAETLDEDRRAALQQGHGAGDRGDEEHEEEAGRPDGAQPHGVEDRGEGAEDEARAGARLQTDGEDGGEDGQAGHEGGAGVEHAHPTGGLEDVVFLVQVGAVGHGDGHAQREREEDLPQGHQHHLRREGVHRRLQQEFNALAGARERHAPHDDHQQEDEEQRHQNLAHALDARADAAQQHPPRHGHEDDEADQDAPGVGDVSAKGCLRGLRDRFGRRAVNRLGHQRAGEGEADVFHNPTADDRVVREDGQCHNGADPAQHGEALFREEVDADQRQGHRQPRVHRREGHRHARRERTHHEADLLIGREALNLAHRVDDVAARVPPNEHLRTHHRQTDEDDA